MINDLALKCAQCFVKNNSTKFNDIEVYQYGFFVLFTKIYFWIFTIIIGAVFNVLVESVVFYFSFSMIRQFAGGYHARSELKCEFITSSCIVFSLLAIRLFSNSDLSVLLLLFALISSVIILLLAPIGAKEKPLNENEYRCFRRISLIILFLICLTMIISFVNKFKLLFVPNCLCLILESLLLITGKIKNHE